MPPRLKTALFVAIAVAVIAGLIAGMMYIDSIGEPEGTHSSQPKDAADQ
ncbi:MAG TPA: hypothetical protein VFF03_02795 [Rhodocyclaceae bacterium]|nr:hypothetical protein [Rhodocyclaceae bacterium]